MGRLCLLNIRLPHLLPAGAPADMYQWETDMVLPRIHMVAPRTLHLVRHMDYHYLFRIPSGWRSYTWTNQDDGEHVQLRLIQNNSIAVTYCTSGGQNVSFGYAKLTRQFFYEVPAT